MRERAKERRRGKHEEAKLTQIGSQSQGLEKAATSNRAFIPDAWKKKTGRAGTMIESFYHAFHGVKEGLREQRNLRVHFVMSVVVSLTALWLKVDAQGWIALIVAMTLVLACEFINTALEHLVDVASGGEYHRAARDAKDTGAAAVLVSAIAAALIGAIVFLPRLIALVGR